LSVTAGSGPRAIHSPDSAYERVSIVVLPSSAPMYVTHWRVPSDAPNMNMPCDVDELGGAVAKPAEAKKTPVGEPPLSPCATDCAPVAPGSWNAKTFASLTSPPTPIRLMRSVAPVVFWVSTMNRTLLDGHALRSARSSVPKSDDVPMRTMPASECTMPMVAFAAASFDEYRTNARSVSSVPNPMLGPTEDRAIASVAEPLIVCHAMTNVGVKPKSTSSVDVAASLAHANVRVATSVAIYDLWNAPISQTPSGRSLPSRSLSRLTE
jgi:hypothetical protein